MEWIKTFLFILGNVSNIDFMQLSETKTIWQTSEDGLTRPPRSFYEINAMVVNDHGHRMMVYIEAHLSIQHMTLSLITFEQ